MPSCFRSVLNPLLIAVFALVFSSSCVKPGQGAGADDSPKMVEKPGMMDKSSMAGMEGKGMTGKDKAMDFRKEMMKEKSLDGKAPAGDDSKDAALQAAKDHDALF